MNEVLNELLQLAEVHAESVMVDASQALMPCWAYVTKSGVTVVGTPWRSDKEKRIMARMVKMRMRQDQAHAYSLVVEAWMAQAPQGWDPDKDGPLLARKQPNRIEVVLAFATDGEVVEWKRWRIKRNYLDQVSALEEDNEPFKGVTSWMTELLPKHE